MRSTVKMAKTIDEAVRLAITELGCSADDVDIEVLEEPKNGLFGFIGAKDAVIKVSLKEEIISEEAEIVQEIIYNDRKKVRKEIELETKEIKENSIKNKSTTKKEVKKQPKVEKVKTEKKVEEVKKEKTLEKTDYSKIAKEFLEELLDKMNIKSEVKMKVEDRFIKFEIFPEDKDDTGIIIGKRGDTLDAIQYMVNLITNKHSDEYIRISIDINNYRSKRAKSLNVLAQKMARKAKKYKKDMRLEPMNPYERRIIHSALQNEKNVKTVSEGEEPYRKVVIKYLNKK